MRQSKLFAKTIREAPKDEKSINAIYLIRGGFIRKLMAGVCTFLPLGWRVHKKIEEIIKEEMNSAGGQEILMPALHPKKNWEITNRWKYPEMLKLKNRSGKDYSLGWTHEEIITPLVKEFINSYKDLPLYIYQIQDKFRDELRAKSGLLRGVEFVMKDLYSFHRDEKDLDNYYEKMKKAYFRIFERCGLKKETFLTLASGGAFSPYSHEFQTVTNFGEDEIYLCRKCRLAVNKEIIEKEKSRCPNCQEKNLEAKKAIEVGNIFKLKDRFSKVFNLVFRDKDGKEKMVLMGCYGIGLSRLMGTIVEVYHDQRGIIWPKEVAPFQVHLIQIENNQKVKRAAEKLYKDLQKMNIEVLFDDRDKSPGEKFAEADLIGIPHRIVISERTLKKNCVEIKQRDKKEVKLVKIKKLNSYTELLKEARWKKRAKPSSPIRKNS
ncbi:MAG: prolyl-tRNA synthetase [Candidatus Nealsonbacteria bacterium CG02_land_8_20_14_3_00_37_10]|uniref:Proline--tRNA ligase n=1 Tax=Candidatus Nealsonbacteria bacterium CG02_land_8_20_14_3_00_37_10 TaxID=1974699 RepID=A0A2M7D8W1_9BACT|nr:MAG: prolyl-tRNA synthetase [Candidatus Nealsonbacteria bacterium CG02_land_8_20_14_3_00_37_10]